MKTQPGSIYTVQFGTDDGNWDPGSSGESQAGYIQEGKLGSRQKESGIGRVVTLFLLLSPACCGLRL